MGILWVMYLGALGRCPHMAYLQPGMAMPSGMGNANSETSQDALVRELRESRKTELYIILGGGAVSLMTMMLNAAGYEKAALTISGVGIVTGTIYAAVRLAEGE